MIKIVIIVILFIALSIAAIIIFKPKNFPFYDLYAENETKFNKHQWVRLVDIFLLGPFAIWLGYKLSVDKCTNWNIVPYLLYIYAYGTIVYNFSNYYNNLKIK